MFRFLRVVTFSDGVVWVDFGCLISATAIRILTSSPEDYLGPLDDNEWIIYDGSN